MAASKEQYIKTAIWHYNAKRYKEAIEACNNALTLDPHCVRAYHGIARSQTQLYHLQDAVKMYTKAIELEEKSELYEQRGDVYYSLSNYAAALKDHNKAQRLKPGDINLIRKSFASHAKVESEEAEKNPYDIEDKFTHIPWDYEREEWEEDYYGYISDWRTLQSEYN